jgi:hypothetical protein
MLFQPAMAADYAADLHKWLPERAYKAEITFLAQSKHAQVMADEIRAMRATESELRRARDFGDIPLIVLSEKWILPDEPEPHDIEAARIEDELQQEMSRFSRRGKPSGSIPGTSSRWKAPTSSSMLSAWFSAR